MATDAESLRERLPYRDCAGVALFNGQGKVFIGRRKAGDDPEKGPESGAPWQMPQGGIDKGETPLETARRELFEETGVSSIELIAEAPDWVLYDLPDDLVGSALKGKYRGQRQRWFAFRFTGEESEIDVLTPGGGKFRAEFDKWRWEELANTPDLIVDFKRGAYEKIVAAFAASPHHFAMVEIAVRPLVVGDSAGWSDLRHALWAHHSIKELREELADMLKGDFAGFGAFDGAAPVGFAEVSQRPYGDGCDTAPVAWLEGIFVLPAFRRRGIGKRLVTALEHWARTLGLSELGSDAELGNLTSRLSHALWGFGETEHVVRFRKTL